MIERTNSHFEVLVIGGGHAGVEAAWAASRLGANVGLVTMSREAIARMSCNPAIGGLGKGQMVREIDAMGGLMGRAIDRAGIHFRMLNRSKGPAVWAPRAQADRDGYPRAVQELLGQAPSLTILEGSVEEIVTNKSTTAGADDMSSDRPGDPERRVRGVRLADGREFRADTIVVTTGTFLRALMHCGPQQRRGGRVGEAAAEGLSACLRSLGFELGRLKTGTPPRVHRDTIDYEACDPQSADEYPVPFSVMTDAIVQPQIDCWITWTNEAVHERIRQNLHRAPMYSGQIESTGPRYCPSIEDKVVRFAEKPKHQIFLEPEGYDNERVYCNGISTSLPEDVQDELVRGAKGLEYARILQYGYAVEYDWVPTPQIKVSLETKRVKGLFLAGQINGTSGYEEAAAQGLVAGVNAVQMLRDAEPLILRRDEAYIGVMVDDLITRPPTEPYRMFTSRAEYRLQLRADNADDRLTPKARDLGLVDDAHWSRFAQRRDTLASITKLCQRKHRDGVPLSTWLRRPDATVSELADAIARSNGTTAFCTDSLERALTNAKYQGYVDRQTRQVERLQRMEEKKLPPHVDYHAISGLRLEAREKLSEIAPRTLGQAARISGISPADVTVLWIHVAGKNGLTGR